MDIRIEGSANFTQVREQFRALQRQVSMLNAELAQTGIAQQGVNPQGYAQMQRAMRASSQTFRDAANSSGRFYAEQIRVNSATEHYTKLLDKQKLSVRDIYRNRDIMRQAYREQVRLQNSYVREAPSMTKGGKGAYDIVVPRQVSSELNTINSRLAWTKALIASASTQMVNWGKNTQWAGRQLMVGFTVPVAAFGAAAGVLAYQVDKEMTRVKKVYDTTAQGIAGNASSMAAVHKELAQLEVESWATATKAANEYGVAVKDTLSVQAALAATGLSGDSLQASTKETLRIATLGELDFSQATDMTIGLQTAFKITGDELERTFNFINAVENATSLSIADVAEAIPRAASAMAALGVTAEQTAIMLVSMREAGVDPAEGANALKSATGTILAPSPAADNFIKQISDGRVQVTKLAEESNGNLYVALQNLNSQMQGLSALQKQQILVKLFGKYQFNRVSAMITNLGDAWDGTANQSKRAMDLIGKSEQELANLSETELGRFQESVSGKFKIALESVKAELAKMGEPFLKVGIWALKAVSTIAKAFNALPSGLKHAAAVGAILMALVGPITMLIGLGANFTGTIIKGITALVLFGVKTGVVTKDSVAMELATKAATAGFVSETSAVQGLTRQLEALSQAQSASLLTARGTIGPQVVPPQSIARQQQVSNALGTFQGVFAGAFPAQATDEAKELLNTQTQTVDKAKQEAATRKRTQKFLAGSAVSMGVMATAGAAMAISNNETVDKFAQFAMLAAFVVPSIKMMGAGMVLVGKAASVATKKMYAMTIAQKVAEAGSVSSMGKMGVGIRAAATGFAGLMGPLGWITLAVTAIGAGLFLWQKHQKEIYEEQVKTQEALSNSTENWAAAAGKVVREFQRIQQASILPEAPGGDLDKSLAIYEGDSEEMKNLRDAISAMSPTEKDAFLLTKYIDLQNRAGLTAKQAAVEIKAMMLAAGDGAYEADQKANQLLETIGNLSRHDINLAVDASLSMINDDNNETLTESAQDFADIWGEALNRSKSPEEAQALMDKLRAISEQGMNTILDMYTDSGKDKIREAGVNTVAEYYKAIQANTLDFKTNDVVKNEYLTKAGPAADVYLLEQAIAAAVGEGQRLDGTFTSIDDLLSNIVLLSRTFTLDEAQKAAQEIYQTTQDSGLNLGPELSGFTDALDDVNDQQKLQELNQLAYNNGIKQSANLQEQMRYIMYNIRVETSGAADEAGRMADNLNKVPQYLSIAYKFDGEQGAGILRDAMSTLQDSMAENASRNFDNRMQNSIDNAQSGWDDKIDAQQRAQEDAMDRFDSRWDRRRENVENYYDSRIEKINDAIEAEEKAEEKRQKIFDAEMSRLDRLNQMANQNIDFNVALNSGNLDEAAKIRNDSEAQYAQWMLEDAAGKTGSKSERKIDRLNNQSGNLEDQREEALKALEKRENDERKHLERLQDMRQKALKDQADADMDARKVAWDLDKEAYDARLDLFKSWTGRSIKDLERWMDKTGFAYEDFGDTRLKPMGQEWSAFFRDRLYKEIRNAGHKVANDNMWKTMATKGRDAMLDAFGFGNLAQLSKFVRTGKMPTNDEVVNAREERNKRRKPTRGGPKNPGLYPEDFHSGGLIGGAGSGRRGVARTQKGLHQSERLVRARKDEFMINERSYKANSGLVEGINSANGTYHGPETGVMGGLGPAGIGSAIMASLFSAGISKAVSNAVTNKKAEASRFSIGSIFGSPSAGSYGDLSFDAEQMKNASTIANVGKNLGMSVRDIAIGIMTAITESSLRNIHGGDRDSQGLFQQRPSQGWGTVEQVTDPVYAATKFFNALKGVSGRDSMSPWMAAQTVQRSAFSDGSNYRSYWDEGQAIFEALQNYSAGYVPGPGGRHVPIKASSSKNIHGVETGYPAIDFSAVRGTPVFAVADGVITGSRDISGPLPTDDYDGDGPYGSYGKVIYLKTDAGPEVLYAHLKRRMVEEGQRVTGGSKIGLSGNTGNSSGPHLHFGATNGPLAWLEKGGTTHSDGLAYLHDNETVVTKPLTKKFNEGVETFSQGPSGIQSEMVQAIISAFDNGSIGSMWDKVWGSKQNNGKLGSQATTATGEGEVKTGTYNVLFSTSNDATRGDLSKLMTRADVLSLTEMSGKKNKLHDWIQKKGWGVTGGDSEVIWNMAKYQALKTGSKVLNSITGSTPASKKREASYALLRNRETGQKFWQVAAHTLGQLKAGPNGPAIRNQQWDNLNELYRTLSSSAPVLMGGDFNTDLRRAKNPIEGTRSNWVGNMNGQYTVRSSYFDHILASMGSQLLGQQVVNGSSDHNALLAQYNIPSLAKGGRLRWDNTLVNGHEGERMLTAENTNLLDQGLRRFANGAGSTYNLTVNASDGMSEKQLIEATFREADRRAARLPRSRK